MRVMGTSTIHAASFFEKIQEILVLILTAFILLILLIGWVRKKFPRLERYFTKISMGGKIPERVKWWSMAIMSFGSLFLYLNCLTCGVGGLTHIPAGDDRTYYDWVCRGVITILPWFVWGCMLAGFIKKYLDKGWFRLPRSMLGAGFLASIIPICTVAAIPIAYGMMLSNRIRVRSVITFLIVVPVLSPVIMVLAVSQIGWQYLLVEIVSIFSLAIATGIIVERYAGVRERGSVRTGCYSCKGCKSNISDSGENSAFIIAWNQFMNLLKYILLGIIIGAILARYVEPNSLTTLFGDEKNFLIGIPGLALIVLIGIPIFICSGQEIVILAPMLSMGLPLGHAIAFAISGNAICITAFPILNATFGKKVTGLLYGSFFFGSILIGLVINVIIWMSSSGFSGKL